MPQHGQQIGQTPDWLPHERPFLPGSPSTPHFPTRFRIIHGLISLLIGVTGSLGQALIQVNLPAIQGSLGLTPTQGAWLTTVYIMTNISMNLLLVKYRQQFGIRRFALVFLGLYTVAAFAHLLLDHFAMALVLRAISGQLLTRGLGSIITFSVMFGVAQNLGGLFGAAMLGTLQTVRTQQVTQQATVLAFNDVFLVVGVAALLQFFYAGFLFARLALRMKAQAGAAPAAPASTIPARETA